MTSAHPLPELYARWMADALPGPTPGEAPATCDDCAMCVKGDGTLPTSLYVFEPDVKCCVYLPRLPNFLVGRALDAEGAASVQARIDAGIGVTPLALDRPPSYELLFRGTINAIGRSRTLRCPHFVEDGGRCGIWRNRDAMCSTWFCRHERGVVGFEFWAALRDLLVVVEERLALWAAVEEGIDAEALTRCLPPTTHGRPLRPGPDGPAVDGVPDEVELGDLWGERRGREAAFYRACAARVDALSWSDVVRIGGSEVAVRAAVAVRRWEAHADARLPERLVVGGFQIAARRKGGVRAITFSSLDAVDLPNALLGVLPAFDGRPVAEVRAELKRQWNVEIDSSFLRRLVDWKILVEPSG